MVCPVPGARRYGEPGVVKLSARYWEGRVMGTEARIGVSTEDPESGHAALLRAANDLAATECALSRFRCHSELSRLNRLGKAVVGGRLLTALERAIDAYEWSDGLLDPRTIDHLEKFGYREGVPRKDVGVTEPAKALAPVDMRAWVDERGKVSLPPGVRLDLAGVGKALGIGWAAMTLAGHAGLLVDVGGDVVALGKNERGEPWTVAVVHEETVGAFSGSSLTVATSTTRRRAWTAGGEEAHHLIDPRTGAPSDSELSYATVAAPTILEADLAAKLLIIEGKAALQRFDERYRAVVTDRHGRTQALS
jgi:thiamine biosynthesis lipoprotein